VEDERTNQRMIKRRLQRRLDHDIVTADNGREALEAQEDTPFDIILMDLSLPGMDGWEATREIRERDGARPFIVALTAHAMEGDEEKALEAGCDEFLTKPINFDQLVELIENHGDDE
jgi:CheY-like chemotaxis protein